MGGPGFVLMGELLLETLQDNPWGGGWKSGISTRNWVSLATFREDGMVCPKFLAGTHLPTVVGVWDLDDRPNCGRGIRPLVESCTRCGKTSDSDWTTVNQIQRSLLSLLLSVFLCLSSLAFSVCGEGAFTNGLRMPF